jgi:hypothetical protein
MFDFIGDIHGHAEELEELLQRLGYLKVDNFYAHPTRKVLFVGDYIDRGPKIRETLKIVKSMVDNNAAIALMGNHEYNALCFHFQETAGGHLRKHLISNIIQHYETLKQFQNRQSEYEMYLEWFKTLPVFYEVDNFRAVHACWDDHHINFLKKTLINNRFTDDLIYQSVKKGTKLNIAIEETLKGKEMRLPKGLSFLDKDGTIRTRTRIKWWEDLSRINYKMLSLGDIENLPDEEIDSSALESTYFYPREERPVFFGHYWLRGEPTLHRENICCLDYSVAKGGHLLAYRFDDEAILNKDKMLFF